MPPGFLSFLAHWMRRAQELNSNNGAVGISSSVMPNIPDVRELQRDLAGPTRVHKPHRRVDQQAVAGERALALHAGHDVVWDGDVLQGAAQRELAEMQHERAPALLRADLLGHVRGRLAHVDVRPGVVPEHEYLVRQADIHARGLDRVGTQRAYDEPVGAQLLSDAPVTEYHDAPLADPEAD